MLCIESHFLAAVHGFQGSYVLFYRVDSIMLVEEGFDVMSVDASDKMLKYALKSRWERRKEPAFDRWGEFFCPVRHLVTNSLLYGLKLTVVVLFPSGTQSLRRPTGLR